MWGLLIGVLLFVFDGWDVAEFAVEAAVVVPIYPVRDGYFEVVDVAPGTFVVDQFGFEQ